MGVTKVRFKNGADAPEIVLDETFEDDAAAKDRLEYLTHTYGTVPDAAAWIDGTKAPKSVSEPVEVPIPEDSSLNEFVPSAGPAPEVLAAAAEEEAKRAAA